jgi:hypothetical protein
MKKLPSQDAINFFEDSIFEQLSTGPKTSKDIVSSCYKEKNTPLSAYYIGYMAIAEQNLIEAGIINQCLISGEIGYSLNILSNNLYKIMRK